MYNFNLLKKDCLYKKYYEKLERYNPSGKYNLPEVMENDQVETFLILT
jgi:hypothetical protein